MSPRQQEIIARKIATMRRPELVRMLRSLDCGFRMDFTDDYLNSMSLERLRHVVLAATLHDNSASQSNRPDNGGA